MLNPNLIKGTDILGGRGMEYATVAAAPGYFAIGLAADNMSEYRLPVIAWRVPFDNGWSIPVTPAGDESKVATRVSVLCPDGRVWVAPSDFRPGGDFYEDIGRWRSQYAYPLRDKLHIRTIPDRE
jgi:hypothetical protein